MEDTRRKKNADSIKEKHGANSKKKNPQEKKTQSDTTTSTSGSGLTDQSVDSIVVLGKSCSFLKSKCHESGYRLHECASETSIQPLLEGQKLKDVPTEGILQIPSNASFISAKSDISINDDLLKKVFDVEKKFTEKELAELGNNKDSMEFHSVSSDVNTTTIGAEGFIPKEMEKKISGKEKIIAELNQKVKNLNKTKYIQIEENKKLNHQVSLLNRQLRSMYELIQSRNWSKPLDPAELTRMKNKSHELESLVVAQDEEKRKLMKRIDEITASLRSVEKECAAKSRELIEYKNRSTLEMCKLLNQIDGLQKEAKTQSQLMELKILEVQNFTDDEIVNVTKKLEEQYQRDYDLALEKFQTDFNRLASLPKSAMEKLLNLCEPNKVDIIALQKEWDEERTILETKIESFNHEHHKEIVRLKDAYDNKVIFLKTQVESLTSQLIEKQEVIKVFETELKKYKSQSSMNLLQTSSREDDIFSLKQLYTAEIFSEKQVHKLEMNIFEEKVKTLTEEILYYAKNEEMHLNEIENAKKIAHTFREKYELLVREWEVKVEKDFEKIPKEGKSLSELETAFQDFKNLIHAVTRTEEGSEKILMKRQTSHDEKLSTCSSIEGEFKSKSNQMENFQATQASLDNTIKELIESIVVNYAKTVETLFTSHVTELSLKQLEMYNVEKRFSNEITSLKRRQGMEIEELLNKLKRMKESNIKLEAELQKKLENENQNEAARAEITELSLKLIKYEEMLSAKEKMEAMLSERVKELEYSMQVKDENSKRELENLATILLEVKVLYSAKEDLAKELESKVNDCGKCLEKSCYDTKKLYEICYLLDENLKKIGNLQFNDSGDCKSSINEKFIEAKKNCEEIRKRLMETFDEIDVLEEKHLEVQNQKNSLESEFSKESCKMEKDLGTLRKKYAKLEEEKKKFLEYSENLKVENEGLWQAILEMKKETGELSHLMDELKEMKNKVEEKEKEKDEILLREQLLSLERDEMAERNERLEDSIRELSERIDVLMVELANNKGPEGDGVFSVSLQEVCVVYEEEQETVSEMERTPSKSSVACQVETGIHILKVKSCEDLWDGNDEPKDQNTGLKIEIKRKTMKESEETAELEKGSPRKKSNSASLGAGQNGKELTAVCKSLKKERDYLKEENEKLKEEILAFQKNVEPKMKMADCWIDKDYKHTEIRGDQMEREIGKLSQYVKTLSCKLNVMKANNESLLNESRIYLKDNQNLVSELEEAWAERYEIEDQLTKVRKENALLNLHRSQLEEANRRMASLMAEEKPVVSWVKIYETVENIVEEILAIKTSFSDPGSPSVSSTGINVQKTKSELKIMAENLHAQLENKTILCDELIIQKNTLEKELKGLKDVLKKNCSRTTNERELKEDKTTAVAEIEKTLQDEQNKQSFTCAPGKKPVVETNVRKSLGKRQEDSHLATLNLLKKQFKSQTELEEAQFRETLELEVKELKKEMEENFGKGSLGLVESMKDLIQSKYEEEVLELSKEFEEEMEKLRTFFVQNGEKDESSEKFVPEIEKLRSYFEQKWEDMKKRYQELYKTQKKERLEDIEIERIMVEFEKTCFLQEGNTNEKLKVQQFIKEIVKRHQTEIIALQEKYKKELSKTDESNISEIKKLKANVLQIKENMESALKNEEDGEYRAEEPKKIQKITLDDLRAQFEENLEKERKKLNDLLEDTKGKHKKEMADMEEFWTEKLSECETKCAILKAAKRDEAEGRSEKKLTTKPDDLRTGKKQDLSGKASKVEEKQVSKNEKEVEFFEQPRQVSNFSKESLCVPYFSSQSYVDAMEVKTDDDKLSVVRERDELIETVSSLCLTISHLLGFIGQLRSNVNDVSVGEFDETLYKSVHFDVDRSIGNLSAVSSTNLLALDLTTIVQEIKDNLLNNSSDQVRFELDRCLKQVKNDAASILALSCPDTTGQKLCELVKNVEKEKNALEIKVINAEEMQKELKTEIEKTKNKLSQWERNLEIISEGYGEEIIKPQKMPIIDFKDKIKLMLVDQPQEINLLDEICKEGDRLQEEWKQEKLDLQQQIDVADKQIHSLKKFLEEQAAEREQERELFDKEIAELRECVKTKERDNLVQTRTNRESGRYSVLSLAEISVQALESQIKDLTNRLEEAERDKGIVEGEFQNAVKKIWSLREVIQDLEVQLAEVSEKELIRKKKAEKLELLVEEQTKINEELKEEFEAFKNQNEIKYSQQFKNLEEELVNVRREAELVNPEAVNQLKMNLREIEGILMRKAKDLEQLHVSSTNVSCSSPSEDVSLRDQLDASRCSTPDEMSLNTQPEKVVLPLVEIDRLHEKLARHNRAEEIALKYIRDLKMQMRNNRKAFEETQTERDVLLEKLDSYLKENSSLKVRLEEQRCNAGLLQKQLNANLESQINRLEVDVEKLNELCVEKDKQLRDMKEILENTTKALKIRETEALNKTKEENALISSLKTDLEIALDQNQELEKKLEKVKEKLKNSLKVPVLIDTMIDEKNAEIDRLEKEVSRLSNEISAFATSKISDSKNTKRIRFSEPDSFGGCISSISSQQPSTIRNFSDSADLKNSPFKFRQNFQSVTKMESVSSIGPLQLSPRGSNLSFDWKTSSPIVRNPEKMKSPQSQADFQKMMEESKFRREIESKQREISESQLEIDILKRQLVELNQELSSARNQAKEIQNDLDTKEEEIRKLKNNEKSLLMTIESVKKKHAEEMEELENKLNFERGKREKIFEEIKSLEEKKVEIEESFFSLKEDYNEKLMGEQKVAEALMVQVKELEKKNEKLIALTEDLERESERTSRRLAEELSQLKEENECLKTTCLNMSKCLSKKKVDFGVQVDNEETSCQVCLRHLQLESPKFDSNLVNDDLNELKKEFGKMVRVISEKDFSKTEAFSYAISVSRLLSAFLNKADELFQELEAHRKKLMESSVDDLAVKVQKELVLSAKLDRKLLSSIEAEVSEPRPSFERGGGDFVVPSENDDLRQEEFTKKLKSLEKEKVILDRKVMEQAKTIKFLDENMTMEKKKMLEEKERCEKDAKIMELLRVNLEKGFQDLKANERDLKREKQMRMALQKEVEVLKKQKMNEFESKKMAGLNFQLESQKERIISLNRCLEEEKKKNQELKFSLEQIKMEKMSEKNVQKLLETDLALLREQKDDLNVELLKARRVIDSRDAEINLLKRKVNLQEIDIKALNAINDFHRRSTTDASVTSVMRTESADDFDLSHYEKDFALPISYLDVHSPVLSKTKTSEIRTQRHLIKSDVEEALLCLSKETEVVRDVIRKLEEKGSARAIDETLLEDSEVNKRLWALEKEGLIMEIETLKREQESLKRDLLNTCKMNDILKIENSKLKKEVKATRGEVSGQIECSYLQDRIVHLTRKLVRVESYRKALVWQKNYLLVSIGEYQRWEEEAYRKMGRLSSKIKKMKGKDKKKKTFRVAVLAVMTIFRMRYIVKKWQKSSSPNILIHLATQSQSSNRTLAPLASVLGIYNEPVDPLLYQTQNIIQSSSKVLRTPPSRDPGPQIRTLGSKVLSECRETLNQFKENIATTEVSP